MSQITSREVAVGEIGEICLRARSNPQYPLGYWQLDEATTETFDREWYRTKDSATRDADGYYWVLGRTDDVIKSSGYRVGSLRIRAGAPRTPRCAGRRCHRLMSTPGLCRAGACSSWWVVGLFGFFRHNLAS
nr:AMP-binding protein [Saccharopolyspora pogona]